jgi:hypothetical protein
VPVAPAPVAPPQGGAAPVPQAGAPGVPAPPVPGGPGAGPGAGRAGGRGPGQPPHTPAYALKITVQPDGTYTVLNTRNDFSRTYAPKAKAAATPARR